MAERKERPWETRVQLCLSENRCICSCKIRYARIIIKIAGKKYISFVNYGKLDHVFIIYSCEKSLTSLSFCLEGGGSVSKTGCGSEAIVGFKN